VLLPSWVHLGSGRPAGVEALGQNMLALMAHLLVLGAALVPPAATAAAVVWLLRPWAGWWALVPAAGLGLGLVAVEVVLAVRWLGREFDRTDPAAALTS